MHIKHTRLCFRFPPHQISAKPMPLGTIVMQDISVPPQPDHNNHNMANASICHNNDLDDSRIQQCPQSSAYPAPFSEVLISTYVSTCAHIPHVWSHRLSFMYGITCYCILYTIIICIQTFPTTG